MFGAKGSVKNRVYQFWLIRIWREKRKKRKEAQLLKRKQLLESQKKVIEEVVGVRDRRRWKLSKAPAILQKKEGIVVQLSPVGKKPDRVIEIIEEKPKVGIGEEVQLEKKLAQIETETTVVVAKAKQDMKPTAPEDLEKKKKKLEQDLHRIEMLQIEYQTIAKKVPKRLNTTLVRDINKKRTLQDNVKILEETEIICKQELERVEKALKNSTVLNMKENTKSKNENPSPLDNQKNRSRERIETPTKELPSTNQISLKTSAIVATAAGGTLIAFPALFQKSLQSNRKDKSDKKKNNGETVNRNISTGKKIDIGNKVPATKTENENNKLEEKKSPKLKLYRSKLELSKEAEIIIKAELERQKNYLKRLNEKIGKVDVTRRIEYHFKGIHRLLEHVLTFALGIFTIPFSKKRIFGTALGLTLIGNSIRGIRNSLKPTKEAHVYIEWKDFAKAIYGEQMVLKQLNNMVIDSLTQVKGLKEDIEREFYGKVSFQEYDEMRTKLEAMELKLLEKQKQIEEMEKQLEKAEEKNKVKVKQMEEMKRQS